MRNAAEGIVCRLEILTSWRDVLAGGGRRTARSAPLPYKPHHFMRYRGRALQNAEQKRVTRCENIPLSRSTVRVLFELPNGRLASTEAFLPHARAARARAPLALRPLA